jgi:hypothetical protein
VNSTLRIQRRAAPVSGKYTSNRKEPTRRPWLGLLVFSHSRECDEPKIKMGSGYVDDKSTSYIACRLLSSLVTVPRSYGMRITACPGYWDSSSYRSGPNRCVTAGVCCRAPYRRNADIIVCEPMDSLLRPCITNKIARLCEMCRLLRCVTPTYLSQPVDQNSDTHDKAAGGIYEPVLRTRCAKV